jgi:hypothetical protein
MIIQATQIPISRTIAPVGSASPAYGVGDQFGSLMEMPNVFRRFRRPFDNLPQDGNGLQRQYGSVTLQSIRMTNLALTSPAFDIFIFNELPAITSVDNALMVIPNTELLKCVHVISPAFTYASAGASNNVSSIGGIPLQFPQSANATNDSLWVLLKTLNTFTGFGTQPQLNIRFDFVAD